MNGERSGIVPPVPLPSPLEAVFSINVDLNNEVEEELRRYAAEDWNSWRDQAKNALMFYRESFMTPEDHARDNLAWARRNFGPPRHTEEWKSAEAQRIRGINEAIAQLEQAG